jgi:Flp pilus assembly pilin Flp
MILTGLKSIHNPPINLFQEEKDMNKMMVTFLTLRGKAQDFIESKIKGQGLVEYAFLLLFIALVALVAVKLLGTSIKGLFTSISTGLGQ